MRHSIIAALVLCLGSAAFAAGDGESKTAERTKECDSFASAGGLGTTRVTGGEPTKDGRTTGSASGRAVATASGGGTIKTPCG